MHCHRYSVAGPGALGARVEIKAVAWAGPGGAHDTARAGQGDEGGYHIWAAEADVGADGVWHRMELNKSAVGSDHIDAAEDQRGHADVAVTLHGEGIVRRVTGGAREVVAAIFMRGLLADDARRDDLEGPEMAGAGFGDIYSFFHQARGLRHWALSWAAPVR